MSIVMLRHRFSAYDDSFVIEYDDETHSIVTAMNMGSSCLVPLNEPIVRLMQKQISNRLNGTAYSSPLPLHPAKGQNSRFQLVDRKFLSTMKLLDIHHKPSVMATWMCATNEYVLARSVHIKKKYGTSFVAADQEVVWLEQYPHWTYLFAASTERIRADWSTVMVNALVPLPESFESREIGFGTAVHLVKEHWSFLTKKAVAD